MTLPKVRKSNRSRKETLCIVIKFNEFKIMLAVLPFLIQWIALSQFGNQDLFYKQSSSYIQPKSHWSLLQEFQQLPEDEIDHFLPQVCNMILDRDSLADDDLYDYFESVIEKKCADNFVFGTRVCGVLKVYREFSYNDVLIMSI